MNDLESQRDEQLAVLLAQALDDLRREGSLDTASWGAGQPEHPDDLRLLLETMQALDTAVAPCRQLAADVEAVPPGGESRADQDPRTVAGGAGPHPGENSPLPDRISRYRILERLGAGGMGVVYKAHDPDLDRLVALKVPHLGLPSPEQVVRRQRFLREARAAAQIQHPHVCAILDVDEHDGSPYVVMAFVEGQSLAHRLRTQGRYEDLREAIGLIHQMARALEAVHRQGIIHRDLKPGNILLNAAGQGILADFGLARTEQPAEHLTADGVLLGTPAYMAPEQAGGLTEQVDRRSDLYSLGVVFYQVLTGHLPFEGPTPLNTLHSILNGSPRQPCVHRPDLDPTLDAMVLKALARQREERFQTAHEFAETLQNWLTGVSRTEVPVVQPPTGEARGQLALLAPAREALTAERQTVVLSGLPGGQELKLALSPGATANVKVTMSEGARPRSARKRRRLFTVNISVSVAVLLLAVALPLYLREPAAPTERSPSSDPARAAAERKRLALEKELAEASTMKKFAEANKAAAKAAPGKPWKPPPSSRPPLVKVKLIEPKPGGERVTVVEGRVEPVEGPIKEAKILTPLPEHLKKKELVVTKLTPPEPPTVPVQPVQPPPVEWVATGVSGGYLTTEVSGGLLTPGGSLNAEFFSSPGKVLTFEVAPRCEKAGLALVHDAPVWSIAFSPDGKQLASASGDGTIQLWELANSKILRTFSKGHADRVTGLAFPPDGKRLASAARHENVKVWDTTSGKLLLTLPGQSERAACVAFSPDGKRLASVGAASGKTKEEQGQVKLWDAATAKELLSYKGHPGVVRGVAFSPDGKFLASAGSTAVEGPKGLEVAGEIKVWEAGTGKALLTLKHSHPVSCVAFSPDGKYLASGSPDKTVMLWDAAGVKEVRTLTGHTNGIASVAFSPDGQMVLAGDRDGAARLWDVVTGKVLAVLPRSKQGITAVAFSPNGRMLATASEDGSVQFSEVPEFSNAP
jgi:WD40 repeat protein/tRNA A-37 threonylcarbamoyl transferase component Bud32